MELTTATTGRLHGLLHPTGQLTVGACRAHLRIAQAGRIHDADAVARRIACAVAHVGASTVDGRPASDVAPGVPSRTRPGSVGLGVVTHQRAADLRACLASLRSDGLEGFDDLIVVDNASTDDTAAVVTGEFPEFRLVSLPENLGCGLGRNHLVASTDTEWLVWVDDDGTLPAGFGDAVRRAILEYPTAAVIGGLTRNAHDARADHEPGPTNRFVATVAIVHVPTFLAVGGFPVGGDYGEERNFQHLLRAYGDRPVICDPRLIIDHPWDGSRERMRRVRTLAATSSVTASLLFAPAWAAPFLLAARIVSQLRAGVRTGNLGPSATGIARGIRYSWTNRASRRPLPLRVILEDRT